MGLDPVTGMLIASGVSAVGGALSKPKGISAPKNRSYLGEMQDALNSQNRIQGQLLDQEAYWTPKYQELQAQNLGSQMKTLSGLYGQAISTADQLRGDYASSLQKTYGEAGRIGNQLYQSGLDAGTKNLYSTMQRQAQADLAAGMALTPEMERQAQQAARAAMTQRGLAGGGQGVAAEVLNSYNMGIDRQNRARQYAGSIYGAGLQQQQNAYSQYTAPMMSSMQTLTPAGMLGVAEGQYNTLGAKIFQPESQYLAGVYGSNQSNQMQAKLASQQASAGFGSGLMSMVGNLGGALLGNPALMGGGTSSITSGMSMVPQGFGTGGFSGGSYYGGMGSFSK